MILVIDLLTALVLDIKFFRNIIIGGDGAYKRCLAPIVDMNEYYFISLTYKVWNSKDNSLIFTSTNALSQRAKLFHTKIL